MAEREVKRPVVSEDGHDSIRWAAAGPMGIGYGQYRLDTGADLGDEWPDTEDGLTIGDAGWAVILTGTEWGSIDLSLQLLDAAPAKTGPPLWEMVVERDLLIPRQHEIRPGTPAGGRPYQISITDIRTGDIAYGIPAAGDIAYGIPAAPGLYRIRISVANRDRPAGPEAAETHLIQAWPAAHDSGPRTLAGPDGYARARLTEQDRQGVTHPITAPAEDVAAASAVAAIHEVLTAVHAAEPSSAEAVPAIPLRLSRDVAAAPPAVYAMALKLDFWLGWGGTLDTTVGGRFTTWVLPADSPQSLFATGQILDLADNERVVLSWQWSGDGGRFPAQPAQITVTLDQHPPTTTTTHLVVHGLPHERVPALVDLWTYYLDRLVNLSEGSAVGPHPWLP